MSLCNLYKNLVFRFLYLWSLKTLKEKCCLGNIGGHIDNSNQNRQLQNRYKSKTIRQH